MKRQLIVFNLVLVVSAFNMASWSSFKEKHEKSYGTKNEEILRFNIFKENVKKIEAHNKKYDEGLVTWFEGINEFSDLTEEEFEKKYLMKAMYSFPLPRNISLHITEKSNIPSSIDWRSRGYVTPVKNQGACGSCWSFSAVGSLEALYFQKYRKSISLSEQYLVDCVTAHRTDGCNGGFVEAALEYVRDHGIVTEKTFPYKGRKSSTCTKMQTIFNVTGYRNIAYNNENELKNVVGLIGPVSVSLFINPLQRYTGGIFNGNCQGRINHAVLVIGYGRENGQEYWILKNSFGASWGEKGYFRLAYGRNLCSMTSQACYPYL